MRILATLILATVMAATIPTQTVIANDAENQNTNQKMKIKKTATLEDNFLVALYAPKIGNTQFSRMYKNRLLSENFILPKGSFVVNASAYTAAADECGKSDGITASGKKVREGFRYSSNNNTDWLEGLRLREFLKSK